MFQINHYRVSPTEQTHRNAIESLQGAACTIDTPISFVTLNALFAIEEYTHTVTVANDFHALLVVKFLRGARNILVLLVDGIFARNKRGYPFAIDTGAGNVLALHEDLFALVILGTFGEVRFLLDNLDVVLTGLRDNFGGFVAASKEEKETSDGYSRYTPSK
jgi:hypothetical protein